MEEKPEQTVNIQAERKEIASTVVNPMTCKEIQDQMSGFPEVIENPCCSNKILIKINGVSLRKQFILKRVIYSMTTNVDCSIIGNSRLNFSLSSGNKKPSCYYNYHFSQN